MLLLLLLQLSATYADEGRVEFRSAGMQLYVEELAQVEGVVWALDFVAPNTLIFTVRRGEVVLLDTDTGALQQVSGVPVVHRVIGGGPFDQVASGGLFDVLVDNEFADNHLIYLAYVKQMDKGHTLAVARAELKANKLTGLQDIFVANNASDAAGRWGTRLAMDADRYLYIAVGDRRNGDTAQDLKDHGGSIVRLHADGTVPEDNPFTGRDDAAPEIWSYGHRNPQGLAIQPGTGALFEHEHGPDGGDEINIIKPGSNYGWPIITYGISRAGTAIGIGTERAGLEQPIKYYKPGIAPSGMSFYSGTRYPAWNGNLFSGSLNRMHLNRLVLDGTTVVEEERLLEEWGERIRDIVQGPDGRLYLVTGSGKISRLVSGTNL
jgi:glucose/arabinose dehydrogenase